MDWKAIGAIVRGWAIAPISGIVIAFVLTRLVGIWFAV